MTRWPVEHVVALAPDAAAAAAARRAATPGSWRTSGTDEEAVWGLYGGSTAEPYQVVVELEEPAFRCSCPSRKLPCKHSLALLLLWASGHVPTGGSRPAFAAEWLARRASRRAATAAREVDVDPIEDLEDAASSSKTARAGRVEQPREQFGSPPDGAKDKRAAERAARVSAGLQELDRWLCDTVRGGLTKPDLAQYATWDVVAARLVDAQAGSLANRIKRVAGLVGVGAGWHEQVLSELAVLHLISDAGRRLQNLPDDLGDSVRTAIGWNVRQADVIANAPESGRWRVVGRSDTLEDRIVVRRIWLRSMRTGRWALSLSFAAYGQTLDDTLRPGALIEADVHRYPGRREVRVLLDNVKVVATDLFSQDGCHIAPIGLCRPTTVAGGCDEVGSALADVPWIERWPIELHASPAQDRGRWVLTDHTGSLPIVANAAALAPLVAESGGYPVGVMAEWTSGGLIVLAVGVGDRVIDVGPRGGFEQRRWNR